MKFPKWFIPILFVGLLIIFIIIIILKIAIYRYNKNMYNNQFYYDVPRLQNWMKDLNDTIPFNKIVLPGTHDSLTYDWENTFNIFQIFTGFWAKTQYLTIGQQLKSGTRYVDARVGYEKVTGKVVCFHGDVTNYNEYTKVIDELSQFCNENPSEIIVWKLRIEKEIDMALPLIIDLHKKLNLIPFLPGHFSTSLATLRNARLDKTRAGIILVSSFECSPFENTVWSTDLISDPYDYDAIITNKNQLISTMNKIYSNQKFPEGNLSVMQFIAAYQVSDKISLLNSVENIGGDINSLLLSKTIPPPPVNGYNVIMVDFLSPDVASAVISLN